MNGDLSDAGKAAILRGFSAAKAEQDETMAGGGSTWRWTDGVILFPEGRCPYCREVIYSSDRIWVVGNPMGYREELLARYRLSGRRLVKEHADHPHVNGTSICMGDSRTAAQALFYALNPAGAYQSRNAWWQDWLQRVWGHDCTEII